MAYCLLLRLCVSLLARFIYPKPFIISNYITLGAQMAHDCQILCFRAVLAIGIATNSSVCVFSFILSMARLQNEH